MNRSPEEYFQAQDLSDRSDKGGFSTAEKAFMEKYMGVDTGEFLQELDIRPTGQSQEQPPPDEYPEMSAEDNIEDIIRETPELLMVAFFLGRQEFTIPTCVVQEVIRSTPISKLPAAPPMVSGVVNLRGKVTPIIRLRDVLEVSSPREAEDKFIVVCRRQGIQIGMAIERVHTMYRISQSDIDWNVEARLGINVDYVAGLLKLQEQLVGIISVDRIIKTILA